MTAAAVLALGLAACAAPDDTLGGGPVPQQFDGETYPGQRRQIVGKMHVGDNGCFLLDALGRRLLVVWPAGTDSLGDRVELPDGAIISDGQEIDALGLAFPTARLPGIVDGYWGSQVGFCTPDQDHVFVLDTVR